MKAAIKFCTRVLDIYVNHKLTEFYNKNRPVQARVLKGQACSSAKCRKRRLNSAQKPSRGLGPLPKEQLGCVPQVVSGEPLAFYMLGLSGCNTDNLTSNHSGALCWERCHIPRMLKNPAVVFDRNRNLCVPPQGLNCPNLPIPPFSQWQSKFFRPYYPCVPSLFFIPSSFHVHFIIHFMSIV